MAGALLQRGARRAASALLSSTTDAGAALRAYGSLRRRADFARVSRRGRRRNGQYLTCLVLDGYERTRIGITVSARIGGAVVRNRLRRRIQAILDRYSFANRPQLDVVLIARPGAAELTFEQLMREVERTFGSSA